MYEWRGKKLGWLAGFWLGFLCGSVVSFSKMSVRGGKIVCRDVVAVGAGEDTEFGFGCVEVEVSVRQVGGCTECVFRRALGEAVISL